MHPKPGDFRIPTANSQLEGIAAGSDGNLWFTEQAGNKIGRVTPRGDITEFLVPTPDSSPSEITSGPAVITAGPDGNIWFIEFTGNKVSFLSPQ